MKSEQFNTMVSLRFPGDKPPAFVPRFSKNEYVRLLKKLAALKAETLILYTAMEIVEPFHASKEIWRVIDGANKTGKTSAAAIEVGRCVTRCDPYKKYPRKGRVLAIGLDEIHLANPMGVALFSPGQFKLIRDENTHLHRMVRPNPADPTQLDPYDAAYREKWIDAPPILPSRLIRSISWKNVSAGVPLLVKLPGWEIAFRASGAAPKQGDINNLVWFDEQIEKGGHFIEAARSIMACNGVGIWSATPQNVSMYLWELRQRADRGDPHVFAVKLLLADNPFMPTDRKEEFLRSLHTGEEKQVRYYGEYVFASRRIYPMFNAMGIHGCEPNEVPADATRYVWLDPGRAHCATVFIAVDRNEMHHYVYDSFDLHGVEASARQWAEEIKRRQGPCRFEAFGIDQQMGQEHQPGPELNVAEQYWKSLLDAGIKPRILGPGKWGGFFPGCKVITTREEALIDWMHVRSDGPFAGTPNLKIVRGRNSELEHQIDYARRSSDIKDKRVADEPQDLVTVLEYAAAANQGYHEPEPLAKESENYVVEQFQKKQQRNQLIHNGRRVEYAA